MKNLIACLFILCTASDVYPVDTLAVQYDSRKIVIDGLLDEWEDIDGIIFRDTVTKIASIPEYNIKALYPEGFPLDKVKPPLSRNRVEARFIWNMSGLSFAFRVTDEHLFCDEMSFADKPRLHHNDGIEIYIDTKSEGGLKMDINDYQFIVDIHNNSQVFRGNRQLIGINDLAVPKDFDQNVLFKSATRVSEDTVNAGYSCEVLIPFAAIGIEPRTDFVMRLDLCCNDIDYPRSDAIYVERVSTLIWPFNWNGYSDFGYPKYWRPVRLAGGPGWFESFSEQYKKSWLYYYLATIVVSVLVILIIVKRFLKLKRLPTAKELNPEKFIFINIAGQDNGTLSLNQQILRSAADYIKVHKNESLQSEKVAESVNINLRKFQRITKQELNLTPTQYISIIKLKLAAEFLVSGQGNVTDAAYEFGFSNPSYFSKIFKNHFNMPPLDYIKAHQE